MKLRWLKTIALTAMIICAAPVMGHGHSEKGLQHKFKPSGEAGSLILEEINSSCEGTFQKKVNE
jgi:hypothetical protein